MPAIELYAANNGGALPGASGGTAATFKNDLAPYIRGPFPSGPVIGNTEVNMKNDGVLLTGHPNPIRAWRYDYTTGEFIFNYDSLSNDGVTNYDEF